MTASSMSTVRMGSISYLLSAQRCRVGPPGLAKDFQAHRSGLMPDQVGAIALLIALLRERRVAGGVPGHVADPAVHMAMAFEPLRKRHISPSCRKRLFFNPNASRFFLNSAALGQSAKCERP